MISAAILERNGDEFLFALLDAAFCILELKSLVLIVKLTSIYDEERLHNDIKEGTITYIVLNDAIVENDMKISKS